MPRTRCPGCGRGIAPLYGGNIPPTNFGTPGWHVTCCYPPGFAADLLALMEKFPRLTYARLATDLGEPINAIRIAVNRELRKRVQEQILRSNGSPPGFDIDPRRLPQTRRRG